MKANCFFTYNIDTLCFRAIDNEKEKYLFLSVWFCFLPVLLLLL